MILPTTAVLELTSRCNNKCIFCYCPWEYDKEYRNKELPTETWCKIIDLYVKNGVNQITFSGGEPLLREDLFELIDFAHKKNLAIGLITNGKNVDDSFLEKLSNYTVSLSISVPGIKTYKEHTGVDNVEHVLNIFKKCKEYNISAAANVVVSKKNISELYQNISLPILCGASYIVLNRFLPGGRGMHNKEFLLSGEEINQMLDVAEEVLSLSGCEGHVGTELPYCIIKEPQKYKHLSVSTNCGAVKTFFATDPAGYIKVCNHSPKRLCKWDEVESLKENETWNRYLTSDYLPVMCRNCEHTDKCDGGCREAARVNYGNINSIDPCFDCKNHIF